jgi:hypothetical protein
MEVRPFGGLSNVFVSTARHVVGEILYIQKEYDFKSCLKYSHCEWTKFSTHSNNRTLETLP